MNRFFISSLVTAATLRNKHARLAVLLVKIVAKISRINWRDVNAVPMKEKLDVLVRMAKAYVCRQYRVVPWQAMATVMAAFIYFLNPFDLVPDLVPVLGLGDDFAVLMWVYQTLAREVEQFVTWEKAQPSVS